MRAADSWVKQAVLVLNLFVAPLTSFAKVAVVRPSLPEIGDATNETAVRFDVERASNVAESANGLRRVQFPRVEPEVAIGQRSDWADCNAHPARGAERLGEICTIRR